MRKPTEDPIARTVAENFVTDHATGVEDTRAVLGLFPTAEFETVTKVVQGQSIRLRRLVLTGPWEVDPNAPKTAEK